MKLKPCGHCCFTPLVFGTHFCSALTLFVRRHRTAVHPRSCAWPGKLPTRGIQAPLRPWSMKSSRITEEKAKVLASQLNHFPPRDKFNDYKVMSDVATTLFIKAETLMHQGKNDEAIKEFKDIIAQYPWAQCFDPSRGAYWSVAEKSQDSIDVMEGKNPQSAVPVKKAPRTSPVLQISRHRESR